MKIKTLKILSSLLFIILFFPTLLNANEKKQMRINWDDIDGIKKYRVQIKDENDKIMIDEETEVTYLDFILPAGNYQLRIGSLNKFNKINTWSDWESIIIIATKKHDKKSKGSKYKPKIYNLNLIKMGFGYSYYFLLPKWDNNYNNSYINAHFNLGLYLGAFNKLKKFWFFRHSGLEFEFHYIQFQGREVNNVVSDLQNLVFGFNIYLRSNFKFPINILFRAGGGVSYTIQEFRKYTILGTLALNGELQSLDFYFKPEIAAEFRAAKVFYVELGMGFITILYKDEIMYSLKPFVMFGFTF